MKEWRKMPSYWIRDKDSLPLRSLKWGKGGANQTAALMLYVVFIHHANDEESRGFPEVGLCSLSYSELSEITGLSRAKIAGGLSVLYKLNLVSRIDSNRTNIYRISRYSASSGWAKLPAKGLYSKDLERISAFQDFTLRKKVELNALKIYFLIVAQRNNRNNYAEISYDGITQYTGVHRSDIKSALSLLVGLELIRIDSGKSETSEFSANLYRPCFLEVNKHRGTLRQEE